MSTYSDNEDDQDTEVSQITETKEMTTQERLQEAIKSYAEQTDMTTEQVQEDLITYLELMMRSNRDCYTPPERGSLFWKR